MQALLSLAPSGPIGPRLQVVADALTEFNVLWLQEQLARGNKPPCCSHCAGPPWTGPHNVGYVSHHGAMAGELRAYLDGPTMMHTGKGTCIDIAAYDAACRRIRGDATARAVITGDGPAFHCVVVDATGTHDVASEFEPSGCGCAR